MATNPSSVHQNTRCATGASILPPAVIVSITSEPLSEDVTKKITNSTSEIGAMIEYSGY